jgi:glycosyltransferase involved in cell wall biosynthesis
LAGLRKRSLRFKAIIVGSGPEEEDLRQLAERLGLSKVVAFTGGLPHREVLRVLAASHILVLGSETEGWPKSLAEAMAHGLICIGSNRGLIPFMLSEGRGFTIPVRDVPALTEILARIVADYDSHRQVGAKASGWARQYSLESLKEFLRNLMLERWHAGGLPPVPLRAPENEAPSS